MGQARTALSSHWPEYLIEAAGLGLFMLMAGICVMLVNAPDAIRIIGNADTRRALVGVAMGLTAIAIIYSPWGRRSGAHLNPAVTLTFLRLGKVAPTDAAFYVLAQFAAARAARCYWPRCSASALPCRRFRPRRRCLETGANSPHSSPR